jgi:hypothetical protein
LRRVQPLSHVILKSFALGRVQFAIDLACTLA